MVYGAPSSLPEIEIEVSERHVHYLCFDVNATHMILLGFGIKLFGWSVRNPSGSVAAVMDLYDGTDSTGVPVFTINLATAASDSKWFGPNGIQMNNALYANVTAGEVKGSVFYQHVR